MAPIASLRVPYRAFHLGYPGSGKTGALAALANAGFKLRILDYDGNAAATLTPYLNEKALQPGQVDVLVLIDPMRNGDKYVEPIGIPTAFNDGLRMLYEWKYKLEDGTEVNLGKSSEWGQDTIVVVDTLSKWAMSSKLRAMKMNNKTPGNMTSAVWGQAGSDLLSALSIMKNRNHHMIINSHKQIIGPQDFLSQGDEEVVKEKKLEMIAEGMIPPRIYPIAVTKPQAQNIHGELPIMLEFEKITKLGKEVRVINTQSGPEIDIKAYGNLKAQYPVETGLLDIFTAYGYKAPGF